MQDYTGFLECRAGYLAHPAANMAEVRAYEGLDRLPRFVLQHGMHSPSVSRIRTWVLARVGRLWSQLTPRKSASEIVGVAVDAIAPGGSWSSRTLCSATRSTSFDAA